MVGGVLGGLIACRFLFPVDQPETPSAAQCLAALDGGLIQITTQVTDSFGKRNFTLSEYEQESVW